MKRNDAGAKNQEAFTGIFGALKAVYEAEIERLTEFHRPRILAGEFSGSTPPIRISGIPQDEPRHIALEREIEKTHPWARDAEMGRAVLAVSGWAYNDHSSLLDGAMEIGMDLHGGLGREVGECLAHDILTLAASRGWVKGYKPLGPSYVLKVA